MNLEDTARTIAAIGLKLDGHSDSFKKMISMFAETATVLEKHTKEIHFLGEQLVDIAKKVNESLMIANAYERKQIRMEKDIQGVLKNLEGLK